MTNCPNCGAPYALNSRVCEYCGTVRAKSSDEITAEQELEQARANVEQARQEFLTLRLKAAQKAKCDNITINLGNGNVIVNSAIGVNHKVARHSGYGIDGEYEEFKQSLDTRYNALKGRAASDSKQADELDEMTEAEARLKLAAMLLLPLVIGILGGLGAFVWRIQNEIVQCFCNLAFICGLCGFVFMCVACGLAYACAFFEANFEADTK